MLSLRGTTMRHNGNGRRLGYPTANIRCPASAEEGVFIGLTTLVLKGKTYNQRPSLVFVGTPVTVGDRDKRLETHILDFPDTDLYGTAIEVKLVEKIRDNILFPGEEELVTQMQLDESVARQKFASQSAEI